MIHPMWIVFIYSQLVFFIVRVNGQTLCSDQLYNYYLAKGLTLATPEEQVINFTTGVNLGLPFVTATINFQGVARMYQANLTVGANNTPYVSYVSFDNPWCTSGVSIVCSDMTQFGMAKICTNIPDFDQGSPDPVAGRFYVYANQSAGCDGVVNVTFFNTTLLPEFTANYIYDARGITNFILLNESDAQTQYRYADCQYSTGNNVTFIEIQRQFACVDQVIGCTGDRPPSQAQGAVVAVPRYSCYNQTFLFNNVTNTTIDNELVIWFVYSFQPLGAQEGVFRADFISPATLSLYYSHLFNPFTTSCVLFDIINFFLPWFNGFPFPTSPCINNILLPSTRRQFLTNDLDYCGSMLLNSGSGPHSNWNTVVINAAYIYSKDPIIAIVPCICQFTMDCNPDGTPNIQNIDHLINPNNAIPIAQTFGGSTASIASGTLNFTLNGNESSDPDNGPFPLSYYWKAYNITNYTACPESGTPLVNITDPTSETTLIDTSSLVPGVYVFILSVSDGQDRVFTLFNLTILNDIVTAVAPPDFTTVLIPCNISAGQTGTCIPLNGTSSFATNPNITLSYNWTQLTGFNLNPPIMMPSLCAGPLSGLFNTTSSIACFIAPQPGIYEFNLTVTDNVTFSSDTVFVTVVPFGLNNTAPNTTVGPFQPTNLRTNPPINRTIIEFPNISSEPITDAPFAAIPTTNTTIPAVFPVFPIPSNSDFISLFAILIAMLIVLVMAVGLFIVYFPQNEYNFLDRVRYYAY